MATVGVERLLILPDAGSTKRALTQTMILRVVWASSQLSLKNVKLLHLVVCAMIGREREVEAKEIGRAGTREPSSCIREFFTSV